MPLNAPPLYITDQATLAGFCAGLRDVDMLALDTEFIRDSSYYPRLCLIQIAGAGQIACIDPLALPSLDPLLALLYNPGILKVLHAAHQDMEVLFQSGGAVPAQIFDTQLAALVLGEGSQIGYADLVARRLGVVLDKAHARADWQRRPLEPAWLSYAADDVRYLPDLYRQQRAALIERNWLAALTEDFAVLCEPQRYQPQPQDAWRRIREHPRLRGVQRAVLRALAAWRETQAMQQDRPRRWILGDHTLLDLAQRMPRTPEELARAQDLPPATLARHGAVLLERIAAARAELPEQWPTRPRRPQLAARQVEQVDILLTMIAARAHACGIPPQLLAGREDVERLLVGEDVPLRHGWRAAVLDGVLPPLEQLRR
ncbi:MAG TPA: ribonuclease D [Candidatus Competibacteraceae bacterium]|nr:ribonuclease D [Candidatus Competibacteraceae bacterium]